MIGGDVHRDRSRGPLRCSAPRSWRSARAFDLGEHDLTVDPELGTVVVPISAGAPALTQALRALDAEHVPIIDVSLRRPSLDDVFLNLTGAPRGRRDPRGAARAPPVEQGKARLMTAVSTPLGTVDGAQAGDDHAEPARDGRLAPRRAQPPEGLAHARASSSSRSCSRSCSSSCSSFVFGSIAQPQRPRPELQGLRRSRGARPDDGVRRRSSRGSASPTT